jgi:hypothetical protein
MAGHEGVPGQPPTAFFPAGPNTTPAVVGGRPGTPLVRLGRAGGWDRLRDLGGGDQRRIRVREGLFLGGGEDWAGEARGMRLMPHDSAY